ncbi:MAG: ATPase, T2SS/T4P/T4SS family, partial [Limnochordia bacterium]
MSLLARLERQKEREEQKQQTNLASGRQADPFVKLKGRIHEQLVSEIDSKLLKSIDHNSKTQELKDKVSQVVQRVISEQQLTLTRAESQQLLNQIIDEVIGFGPINSLILDPEISEIMVNGPKQVFVERGGCLELTEITFRDNEHVMHIIEKMVAPLGRRIDESSPMVDARLPDGSRVNAIIPPLALGGPTITIRKFSANPLTVEDLINFGTLTPEVAEFLAACVQARLNIVVSGGTGSGKTTLLNVLSSFIPTDERIVTIEDAAELRLRQTHVVSLE